MAVGWLQPIHVFVCRVLLPVHTGEGSGNQFVDALRKACPEPHHRETGNEVGIRFPHRAARLECGPEPERWEGNPQRGGRPRRVSRGTCSVPTSRRSAGSSGWPFPASLPAAPGTSARRTDRGATPHDRTAVSNYQRSRATSQGVAAPPTGVGLRLVTSLPHETFVRIVLTTTQKGAQCPRQAEVQSRLF